MHRNVEAIDKIADKIKNLDSSIYRFINKTDDNIYFFEIYGRTAELINAFEVVDSYVLDFGTSYEAREFIKTEILNSDIDRKNIVDMPNYFQYPIAIPSDDEGNDTVLYIRLFEINTYIVEENYADDFTSSAEYMRKVTNRYNKASNLAALRNIMSTIEDNAKHGLDYADISFNSTSDFVEYNTTNFIWALNKLKECGYSVEIYDNYYSDSKEYDSIASIKW